jgi:hypothetical protein
MSYIIGACPVEPEGSARTDDRVWPAVAYNSAGTGYFDVMRIGIVRGRAFDDRDTPESTPAIIVNETLAAMLWPGADPIGKRLLVRCVARPAAWEVVGVARDGKYIAVFERQQPFLYVAAAQTQPGMRMLNLRTALPLDELTVRLRQEIAAIDADVPMSEVRTMRGVIAGSIGNVMFRVGARQAGAMGLIGLLLAVVGVYGVASYGASQRMREIGIRLALGAAPADVRRMVLGQGGRLVVIGLAIGLLVSAGVTAAIARFVVLVSPTDPTTFVGVTTALAAVALVACYLPARRAMRVNPVAALRHE